MSTRPDRLLWIDLETSTSDEYEPGAVILEVGLTLTANDGVSVGGIKKSFIGHFTRRQREHLWMWPEKVIRMHVSNGLLFKVLNNPSEEGLDSQIYEWMNSSEFETITKNELLVPAGSGFSHFDRRWIKQFLPLLDQRLTHYSIDVGVVRRIVAMHAPEQLIPETEKEHRALTCNKEAIAEYQGYIRLLRNNQDGN